METMKQKEKEILIIVRENLKQLMEIHGLNVSNFCNYIKEKDEDSLDRSTFIKFMNGDVKKANLAFLKSCHNVFGVSLENLISRNFNPYENFRGIEEKYKDIPKEDTSFSIGSIGCLANEIFIENPESLLFKKYIQPYFCYYYSTVSAENNTDNICESLISGKLVFEPNGKRCKAILEIDTKKPDENGNLRHKIYTGYVVLCPSIQSVHCILTLPEGEFCFIIFRYSHLNCDKQECRLAEVLSSSSIVDKRYPVVHRMLLSNEEIKDKDLEIIAPHLCMNSKEILISERGLLDIADMSEEYNMVVQEILKSDSELMYTIEENGIKEMCKNDFSEGEIAELLTKLRAYSFSKRYNKVSPKADEKIRDMLFQRGYFSKKPSADTV